MFKIVKSSELLDYIEKKNVVTINELAWDKALQSVFVARFENAARRRIIDTMALSSRQGYVSVGQIDGEKVYKLSAKGKKHLRGYSILKAGIARPARWDKHWYLVTFDIPENQKVARNSLIDHLKNQNFYNYTKGIWVLPYDPRKFLTDLMAHLGLVGKVKLIVALKLDDEPKLKRHFRL